MLLKGSVSFGAVSPGSDSRAPNSTIFRCALLCNDPLRVEGIEDVWYTCVKLSGSWSTEAREEERRTAQLSVCSHLLGVRRHTAAAVDHLVQRSCSLAPQVGDLWPPQRETRRTLDRGYSTSTGLGAAGSLASAARLAVICTHW